MAGRVDLLEDVRDPTIRADEIRGPYHTHVRLAVILLFLPYTVLLGDRVVGVGEERERQVILLLELRLCRDRIRAHAENDRIESLEPREGVAKLARLQRSAGGIIFRVEVEHDDVAAQLTQRERGTAVRERGELRSWSTFD